jgi:hypothetical protein
LRRYAAKQIVGHHVKVEFDEFGWELVSEEAARQGVTVEELVRHAAVHFVAERDSDRLSGRADIFKRWTGQSDKPADPGRRAKRTD